MPAQAVLLEEKGAQRDLLLEVSVAPPENGDADARQFLRDGDVLNAIGYLGVAARYFGPST